LRQVKSPLAYDSNIEIKQVTTTPLKNKITEIKVRKMFTFLERDIANLKNERLCIKK
jgi:hypothetical protein